MTCGEFTRLWNERVRARSPKRIAALSEELTRHVEECPACQAAREKMQRKLERARAQAVRKNRKRNI